jgi:methyl-accepting chemotaxis protein
MTTARDIGTFRLHLVLTSVAATAVFAALVGASLFIPLVTQLDRTELDSQLAGGIAEHILFLHQNFWPVVLGSLLASIASGMLLYSRMVAPLVRFQRTFEAIAKGDLPQPLTLRRVDYLGAEAESLNSMVSALRERTAERVAALAACHELLDDLTAGAGESAELNAILDELRAALKAVH